tara:strand:- start:852 stop:1157 length:306 start_codon:yes stop_codon:yes gene_type:complete
MIFDVDVDMVSWLFLIFDSGLRLLDDGVVLKTERCFRSTLWGEVNKIDSEAIFENIGEPGASRRRKGSGRGLWSSEFSIDLCIEKPKTGWSWALMKKSVLL